MKIGDEELRLISTFIGPAILAAVVSGVFSILLSRNSARLEYIINERSKWRERIREICQGIQSHNLKEISGSLQRLKLYINAYGIPHNTKEDLNLKAGHILMDTHIWALIISIEKDIQYLSECDEKNSITAIKLDGSNRVKDRNRYKLDADRCKRMKMIDEKCNLLQNYISLLLKNDWEKAKDEISKNIFTILGWILMMAGIIGAYVVCISIGVVSRSTILTGVIAIVFTLMLSYFFESALKIMIRKEMTIDNMTHNPKSKGSCDLNKRKKTVFWFRNHIVAVQSIRWIVFLVINYIWMLLFVGNPDNLPNEYFMLYSVLLLGTTFYAIGQHKLVKNEYYYVVEVLRLKSEFYTANGQSCL